ncbi:MAG: hypothetical protein HDQ95_12180 [Roseburia sp.]|nr:hypothetical protein [Roseburia sp.]
MKKVVTLLTALLLGTLVSTSVYAEANADVWCETSVEGNDLSVSVETNGEATDGVVTIGYDSSVVTCTEADVKVADAVDMYSVNVVDESVRISFLAEDAIDAGSIAEISFKAVDKNADKDTLESAISFTGEAFDESEDALIVKTLNAEEPGNSGSNGGQQNGNNASVVPGNVSTSTTAQAAKTGDAAGITYLILMLTAGVLLVAVAIIKATAGTARKVNK